jgi:hypothetical protein
MSTPTNPTPSPTPTTSEARRLASRQNGSLSVGPITPGGRLIASRNSTKHGFSGEGKHLPAEMEAEVLAEFALYVRRFRPADDVERGLLRRAALGAVRARRIADAENRLIDERTRTAVKRWDEARAEEVAAIAARLDAEPEWAHRNLRKTAEGCDWLGDAWDALGRALAVHGLWDEGQSRRALRLLGIAEDPTPASPGPLRDFWRCVLSLRFDRDPQGLMRTIFRTWSDAEQVRRALPTPADARLALQDFVAERVAEYEALGRELWEAFDAPARESAPTLAVFDPSPEAARLHRYYLDAERMRKQAFDELYRLRREGPATPAPSRDEPEAAPRNEPEPAPRNEPEPAAPEPDPAVEPPAFPAFRLVERPATPGDAAAATPVPPPSDS